MPRNHVDFHEKRLNDMKQEAEFIRQQLEVERLKQELQTIRGGIIQLPQIPARPQNQQMHSLVRFFIARRFRNEPYNLSYYALVRFKVIPLTVLNPL